MFTKDVQYLPGVKNNMADWLSRKTPEALIGEAYKIEKNKSENVVKEEEIDQEVPEGGKARLYRGVATTRSFLSLDRPDMACASTEARHCDTLKQFPTHATLDNSSGVLEGPGLCGCVVADQSECLKG